MKSQFEKYYFILLSCFFMLLSSIGVVAIILIFIQEGLLNDIGNSLLLFLCLMFCIVFFFLGKDMFIKAKQGKLEDLSGKHNE